MKQTRSYTKNDVLKAVEGCSGIISTVAGRLGCDWHTAKKYINQWTETRRAYADSMETVLDFVEGKAIERVKEGDGSMIRFILATKGRKRGYVRRRNRHRFNADMILAENKRRLGCR